MADRVIQRNDTAARWQSINPILATGEIGIEIDGAKGYKIGDGKTRWNDLPYPANPTNVVQELGNNENAVISQKLVTEKLSELGSEVKGLEDSIYGQRWTQTIHIIDYLNTNATGDELKVDIKNNTEVRLILNSPINKSVTAYLRDSEGEILNTVILKHGIEAYVTTKGDVNSISVYKSASEVSSETISLDVFVNNGDFSVLSKNVEKLNTDINVLDDKTKALNTEAESLDATVDFILNKNETALLNENVYVSTYLNQYNSTFPVVIKKGENIRVLIIAPKNESISFYLSSNGEAKQLVFVDSGKVKEVSIHYDIDSIYLYKNEPIKEKILINIFAYSGNLNIAPKNSNYNFKVIDGWGVSNGCSLSVGGEFQGYKSERHPQIMLTNIPINTGLMKVFIKATLVKKYTDLLYMAVRGYDSADNIITYADVDIQEGESISYLVEGSTGRDADTVSLFVMLSAGTGIEAGTHVCDMQFDCIAVFDEYEVNSASIANSICNNGNKFVNLNRSNTSTKTWCAIGDSLTDQATYIAPTLDGLFFKKCVRISQGGKRMSGDSTSNPSMWEDSIINEIPDDAWLITVLGGTNDWIQSVPIGINDSTDTNTFKGALNVVIEKITTRYPKSRLVVMTMPYGELPSATTREEDKWSNEFTNLLGFTPLDYVNATMEVCEKRGVPCVNLHQNVGWNKNNIRTYIKYDGGLVHPNEIGGKRIASVLCGFMNNLMPITSMDI